jgi:hypothetical protein
VILDIIRHILVHEGYDLADYLKIENLIDYEKSSIFDHDYANIIEHLKIDYIMAFEQNDMMLL